MRSVITAKVKIGITPEIISTIKAYGEGLKFCIDIAWQSEAPSRGRAPGHLAKQPLMQEILGS